MDKKVCCAVIVAAGKGKRMKSTVDKQFIELKGRSIVERTVEKFEKCDVVDEIVLVTGEEHVGYLEEMAAKCGWTKVSKVVCGGKERQNSVYNGLCALREDAEIVLIHDGVRPFIKNEEIVLMAEKASEKKACVLAARVKDTIKVCDEKGKVLSTPDRSMLWAMQTPQAFEYKLIKNAYERLTEADFVTDDASVAEKAGIDVFIVEGGYDNIKITTPEDLYIAEAILRRNEEE
ncbi:MAG: 2-C-methyl-D-erythritol 4-phosphate cytidylyltransferase [Firmicutes bacterium]|nr:2-C-methyl-D-erythritol 4-phosphate cytidylyltransferase [Bacillota bacterium]